MTEHDVIEPTVDERSPSADRDHPPFRMRDRRLRLLPDLRPPSVDEIRWAVRQRRVSRTSTAPAPEQRRPVRHEPPQPREPADVVASVHAPPVEEARPAAQPDQQPTEIVLPEASEAAPGPDADDDFFDLHDPVFPDLRPWQPLVLPDLEPASEPAAGVEVVEAEPVVEPEVAFTESPAADDEPPLVSHVLVVREPVPAEPGRIAVLDEVAVETPTITRLVALPAQPFDDPAEVVEPHTYDDSDVEELEELEELPEEPGRAAPLYWRLLRLRHTRPNGWLRALYFEGAVALGVVLVLAEAASVWTIVVLPLIVAVVVKANDVLAGNLRRTYREPTRRNGS